MNFFALMASQTNHWFGIAFFSWESNIRCSLFLLSRQLLEALSPHLPTMEESSQDSPESDQLGFSVHISSPEIGPSLNLPNPPSSHSSPVEDLLNSRISAQRGRKYFVIASQINYLFCSHPDDPYGNAICLPLALSQANLSGRPLSFPCASAR